jgi:hypothetical protein
LRNKDSKEEVLTVRTFSRAKPQVLQLVLKLLEEKIHWKSSYKGLFLTRFCIFWKSQMLPRPLAFNSGPDLSHELKVHIPQS